MVSKKRAPVEPKLVIEDLEIAPGVKLKRHRRGVLESASLSVNFAEMTLDDLLEFFGGASDGEEDRETAAPSSIKDRFVEIRDEFCDQLESMGIPSCRTPNWVSIDGKPWRARAPSDTMEALSSHAECKFANWHGVVMEITEPLSKERLCANHLKYVDKAIKTFDEHQLVVAVGLMRTHHLYMVATGDVGQLANQHLDEKQRCCNAGRKSAETRNAKAEVWQQHALSLAKALRDEHPGLSQSNLASDIAFRWKREDIKYPCHRRIEAFIREKEKNGELPQRAKGARK